MTFQTVAEAAATYHQRGFKPVPVNRKSKRPRGRAWQERPYAPEQFNGDGDNVALQLGEASRGLTDVDLDCTEVIGFAPTFLPPTGALFGRRSRPCSHQLYITDLYRTETKACASFAEYVGGKPGPMLVELATGGGGKGALCTVPPSLHAIGETVQWVTDGEPATVDGAALKKAVTELAVAALLTRYYPSAGGGSRGGSRHFAALALGGVLARARWLADDIGRLMKAVAGAAGDADVLGRIATASCAVADLANGRPVSGLKDLASTWGETVAATLKVWLAAGRAAAGAGLEDTTALAFAEQHGDDYRYVAASGRWMRWAGPRWQAEPTLAAFDASRALCRGAGDARAKTVSAVVTLARTDRRIAATADQWDRDPDIIATPSATVDLRTGETRPARREDYLTKMTGCDIAPKGTPHPRWSTFLDRITGMTKDTAEEAAAEIADLQRFLQRYAGYCLTGHVSEHAFVFGYGTGANGKGTFVGALAKIFGDYACTADVATFMVARQERHPTDIAKLYGARLVIAQEMQEERHWDEAKIKALTGGDRLTGRFMRQDYFDFDPTFKLFIVGNHKPALTSVDEAMKRRLLLVPFAVQIPASERDRDLARKLEAEHPAILRWAVDGCLTWRRDGLNPPQAVQEASEAYFGDQDALQQWLDDEVTADLAAFSTTGDLFAAWREWCEKRNLRPGSVKSFSVALVAKGYEKGRAGGTGRMGFWGMRL